MPPARAPPSPHLGLRVRLPVRVRLRLWLREAVAAALRGGARLALADPDGTCAQHATLPSAPL